LVDEQDLPRGAFSGKVALVVGGASGVGRMAANVLARQGARIVIADFDAARMERTLAEILQLGSADAALALPTDVRSDSSVAAMARDAIKAMGQVDILLNVAGVFLHGPLERTRTADWRWVFETNLLGVVRTTMAVIPHMVERGSGQVVNIISSRGGSGETVAYDTCSAAVAAYTERLAAEMRPRRVFVSLFTIGAGGPRLGQNTRSRGVRRLLQRSSDLEEVAPPNGHLMDELLDVLRPGPRRSPSQ
jgi:NAD(P)-dependent dehydrogenase (short-subunit alcohol dehydrogenase family)